MPRRRVLPDGPRFVACELVGQRFALRHEIQRDGIDAVAQPRGRRAVGEDVALVAVAAGTAHFGADHAVAVVLDELQVRLVVGRGEAGPAGAGLEFRAGANRGRVAVVVPAVTSKSSPFTSASGASITSTFW